MKPIGINVNDRAAIEKYLKEHPQWTSEIQQAVNDIFGIDKDYLNSEYINEFPEFETEDDEYWHNNITSNLRKMSEQCIYSNNGIEYSLYRMLWHPEETGLLDNGNVLTKKYVTILLNLLNELQLHKDKYEMYNPANGWGNYDNLVNFVDSLIASLISINNNDYKNYTVVASY